MKTESIEPKEKRKVLIDIDVVAVSEHYINDKDHPIARTFVDRVESGEFENYTTHSLLSRVEIWRKEHIREKVLNVYHDYCYIIPAIEIEAKSKDYNIIFEEVVERISKAGVKEEDAAIALVSSLFGLALITLNRKHLRNKRDEINKILKEVGLSEISILLPNEI